MCTGSIASAGSALSLPLGQQLVQSTPRHQPQTSGGADSISGTQAVSGDPNRGKHLNIST